MKVAILANYPPHEYAQALGLGPETLPRRHTTWNRTLVKELAADSSLEVTLITRFKGPRSTVIQDGALTAYFLTCPKLINAATLYCSVGLQALRVIRKLQPDIAHAIGTEHIWPTTASYSGLPYVITIQGIVNNILRKLGRTAPLRERVLNRWFALLERNVMWRARHIISTSPYVIDSLGRYSRGTFYPIENPVSQCFFSAKADPSTAQKVVFVGDAGKRKALLTLLEAFYQLKSTGDAKGWKIVVIGPLVPGDYLDAVRHFISQAGISAEVELKGLLPPDALAAEMERAAFLALCSIEETAPVCIAEAMASGLPVVASRVAGIPSMVEDGASGLLFPVGDSRAMAGQMKVLMEHPELREEMGARGRQLALSRWSSRMIANRTCEVYRKVLEGARMDTAKRHAADLGRVAAGPYSGKARLNG